MFCGYQLCEDQFQRTTRRDRPYHIHRMTRGAERSITRMKGSSSNRRVGARAAYTVSQLFHSPLLAGVEASSHQEPLWSVTGLELRLFKTRAQGRPYPAGL
ncbi:MAG: hypothetical protein JWO95_2769 [Verrucomicrobiales bacterium]|nr:hypothetical protein [Verrucomicrobiales bacterium]